MCRLPDTSRASHGSGNIMDAGWRLRQKNDHGILKGYRVSKTRRSPRTNQDTPDPRQGKSRIPLDRTETDQFCAILSGAAPVLVNGERKPDKRSTERQSRVGGPKTPHHSIQQTFQMGKNPPNIDQSAKRRNGTDEPGSHDECRYSSDMPDGPGRFTTMKP